MTQNKPVSQLMYWPVIDTDSGNSYEYWNLIRVPDVVKRVLIKLGERPYIVFTHYLEEAYTELPNFDIEYTASVIGLTVDQIQKAQDKLINANWVYISKFIETKNKANAFNLIALGYNSVARRKGLTIKPDLHLVGLHLDTEDYVEDFDDNEY